MNDFNEDQEALRIIEELDCQEGCFILIDQDLDGTTTLTARFAQHQPIYLEDVCYPPHLTSLRQFAQSVLYHLSRETRRTA